MCNHYRADPNWRQRTGEFSHLKIPLFDAERARPNTQEHLYPGRTGEIVLIEAGRTIAAAAHWRLIPPWFTGASKEFGNKWRGCNNARSEGIETSRMFKASIHNRCLIPTAAIYEYAAEPGPDGRKVEYEFTPVAGPVWIAGIHQQAHPADGPLLTYAMVMTDAGPDALSIGHPRSPIFLAENRLAAWLDPKSRIGDFAVPPPAGFFNVAPAKGKAA
jgi:putative SOS response-associated peptidase YedK